MIRELIEELQTMEEENRLLRFENGLLREFQRKAMDECFAAVERNDRVFMDALTAVLQRPEDRE